MFKIRDPQVRRHFRDGHEFKSVREMVEALVSYHEVDFNLPEDKQDQTMQEYLDDMHTDSVGQLEWLCTHGEREIESDTHSIVTCGKCGAVNIFKKTEGDFTCTACKYTDEQCHFPDLFY